MIITLLFIKKVTILAKYLDFVDIFLTNLVIKLFNYFYIGKYAINLEISK